MIIKRLALSAMNTLSYQVDESDGRIKPQLLR
jgi:hypothetical protein